jgi:glycosyltransferase involved in cell wall biosynthesis
MMTFLYVYLYNALRDFLRFNPVCGAVAAVVLRLRAWLARKNPARRLAILARAARICPTARGRDRLFATMRKELAILNPTAIDWVSVGVPAANRMDIPKGIILKPPVSPEEKGVLCIHFEDQWLRLLRSGHAADVARRYDLILGPSSSPPPDLELLLATKMWPGRLYTLLSNFDDEAAMRRLSDRLTPIPLLASHWVDPDSFVPYLGAPKEFDLLMLAHFCRVKRHWLFFNALRKLPRRFRVLLLGVPLSGRSEKDLMDEARAFGVQDRFELVVRPTRSEVLTALCGSRVSLIFSGQEGSCIAVSESLLADTPVGLFRNARIGSKAFINERTGMLLERPGLANQLQRFVETARTYQARAWALDNISCHRGREFLNETFRAAALREGRPWTRDLMPIQNSTLPSYLTAEAEEAMRPWYDEFSRRYGLRIGMTARPAPAAEKPRMLANVS